MAGKSTSSDVLQVVTDSQLESLNATDAFGLAWQDVLREAKEKGGAKNVKWGGRGQGGRGRARRTYQPHDVVVDNVSLAYVGASSQAQSKALLEDAHLKLLSPISSPDEKDSVGPNIYALVGRNGSGKSTLLKRMNDGSIPGWPPHILTLYLPQEIIVDEEITPVEYLKVRIQEQGLQNSNAVQHSIQALEDKLEALDLSVPEQQDEMERLNEQIAAYEDEFSAQEQERQEMTNRILEALKFMGLPSEIIQDSETRLSLLSPGLRKKVILSTALLCPCDLLLLDEPSSHLDIVGLIQLRRLLLEQTIHETKTTTVLLVSHDLDLVNQVSNHIIEMRDKKLFYYNGNYDDFQKQRRQDVIHQLRQNVAVDKKKSAIKETIQNLKAQAPSKRGCGAKKKQKQIDSQKKKLERLDQQEKIANDSLGVTVPIKKTYELLQKVEEGSKVETAPDKEVQFNFRDPKSQWGEPLILAYEVGYAPDLASPPRKQDDPAPRRKENGQLVLTKKEGFLFDMVELCIEEGGRYCIMGNNGGGKSTLLRLLAGTEKPTEGEIKHATNVDVTLIHQELADGMVEAGVRNGAIDAISFLFRLFPKKSEQEIRSELVSFGIGPAQATTNLRYLSGGERVRLSYAANMLRDPQVLVLDNPTLNLDAESVDALIYGLSRWKGTLVFVSHDTHFIRSLDPTCYVLMDEEGKLRRVVGGVQTYLRSFGSSLKR